MGRGRRAIVALALLVHLALGLAFITSAGPTFDEPVHLVAGYTGLTSVQHHINISEHPPLAEMIAALPLLALGLDAHLDDPNRDAGQLYAYADRFLFDNEMDPYAMLSVSRCWLLLLWTALLFPAVVYWTRELGGPDAAVGAAVIYASTPVLIAHNSLITTDAAPTVFTFLSVVALYRSTRSERPLRWAAACGVAAGCALGSKYSMLLLPGMLIATWVAAAALGRRGWRDLNPRVAALAAGLALVTLIAIYWGYQFGLYFDGIESVRTTTLQARPTYLMGAHAVGGFFWYFPVALVVKSPTSTVALLGLALVLGVAGWRRPALRENAAWLGTLPALYLAVAMTSKVQIGVRHLLPMMPFLVVIAGLSIGWLWQRGRRGRLAVTLLAGLQMVSVAAAHPHQLAHFNLAVGGPANGHRWLVESNLDWGQALPQLDALLEERGDTVVLLAYFGVDNPAAYGIRYDPLAPNPYTHRPGEPYAWRRGDRVWLAVSATHLSGVYLHDHDALAWLREFEPNSVAGHAIFLYDMTATPEATRTLVGWLHASGADELADRIDAQARDLLAHE